MGIPRRLLPVIAFALAMLAQPSAPDAAHAQSATVRLTASAHNVRTGERFRIRLSVEAEGAPIESVSEPDLGAFDIVSRSTSQPMQFSFGFGGRQTIVQQSRVHDYVVSARQPGTLSLGPIEARIGGRSYRSQQIRIRVTGTPINSTATAPSTVGPGDKPPSANQGQPPPTALDGATFDQDGFVRTVVDHEQPYIGQQVTVTVYLYSRAPIRSAPAITQQPSTDGFWVQDLLPAQRTLNAHQQSVHGIPFHVYLIRRFAAFPLRIGDLSIGGTGLRVQTGHGFGFVRSGGPLERTGADQVVRVRELPAPAPDGAFVGEVELEARLDRTQVATGDAVTLSVGARAAAGNVRDIRFALPEIPGLRVLQPRHNDVVNHPQDVVGGTRTTEWLIVPEAPGSYALPALTLPVFNPVTEAWTSVSTPALTLVAAGNAIPSDADTDAEDQPAPPDDEEASENSEPDISFGPIRSQSEFEREQTSIAEAPWFGPSFLIAPLLLLFLFVGRRTIRRARAAREENPERQGQRDARSRLAAANRALKAGEARKVYTHCTAALTLAIDSRTKEPIGGIARPHLRNLLGEHGVPEPDIDEIVAAFETWDSARFSPGYEDSGNLKRTTKMCETLLRTVSEWRLEGGMR